MLFDPEDLALDPLVTYFQNGAGRAHVLPDGTKFSLCSRVAVSPAATIFKGADTAAICGPCLAKARGKVTPRTAMLRTLRDMTRTLRHNRRGMNDAGVRLYERAIHSMLSDLAGMGLEPLAADAVGEMYAPLRERYG